MSEFESMTVAFNKGENFHTLTFDDTHETFASDVDSGRLGGVQEAVQALLAAGYEIVSVVIRDEVGETETLSGYNIPTAETLADFHEAVKETPYSAESFTAFLTYYGWSEWSLDTWQDASYGEYESEEAFAEDFTRERLECEGATLPEYVMVDWEDTARYLENDGFTFVEHNDSTFVFTL